MRQLLQNKFQIGGSAWAAAGPVGRHASAGTDWKVDLGGIVGAIVGMGIPKIEAKRYQGRIKKSGILLSVHCDNSKWTKRAKAIVRETGAHDVCSTGEARADYAKSDKPCFARPRREKPLDW